jgi:hypothetical protein
VAPFRGNIGAGFFENDMKSGDIRRQDTDGFSVNGSLSWFPTELTTVSFSADRSVVDPGLIESASAINTTVGVRVDHELRRNILIFAGADFSTYEFDAINREDKSTNLSLGLGYRMNRNVRVEFSIRRYDNDISETPPAPATALDYTVEQNVAQVSLRFFP